MAAVFSVDVRKSLAYEALALCLGLLASAAIGLRFTRGAFRVARRLPAVATVGRSVAYSLRVTNTGSTPVRGAAIRERPYVRLPGFDEFRSLREPGFLRRNWFDREVGYFRWVWITRLRAGVEVAERSLPELAPGQSAGLSASFTPVRRGRVRFEGADVVVPEPLGLLRRVFAVSARDSVLVYPVVHPLAGALSGFGRRRTEPGVSDSRRSNGTGEFKALREYRQGDPLRRIDWRASARMGRPLVKEFHEERTAGLTIVLDTGDWPYSERFEAAVSVAASLVHAVGETELPGLAFVDWGAHGSGTPVMKWVVGRRAAMAALAMVRPRRVSPNGETERRQAAIIRRGLRASAAVVVLCGCAGVKAELVEAARAGVARRREGREALRVVAVEAEPPVPEQDGTPRLSVPVVRTECLGEDLLAVVRLMGRVSRRVA